MSIVLLNIEPMPPDRAWYLLQQNQPLPAEITYASILAISMYLTYGIVMELLFGATLGKLIFRLRVISDGPVGPAVRVRGILLRNLTKVIEFGTPLAPLLLLFTVINRNRQRLGDVMARTAVVQAAPAAPGENNEGPAQTHPNGDTPPPPPDQPQ